MLNLTAKGGFRATRKQLRYAPASDNSQNMTTSTLTEAICFLHYANFCHCTIMDGMHAIMLLLLTMRTMRIQACGCSIDSLIS